MRSGPLPVSRPEYAPIIGPAWRRLQAILEGFLADAEQIKNRMVGSCPQSYKGLSDIEAYLRATHGILTYTNNAIFIVGGKGSGKSTLLTTLFYHYRCRLYQLLLGTIKCNGVIHIPVDVMDPSIIPESDRIATWMTAALRKLVKTLKQHVGDETQRYKLEESLKELEKSAQLLPVDYTRLLSLTIADVSDYVDQAGEALQAGYALSQAYARFSAALRETLEKIAMPLCPAKPGLILLGFDDIDMVADPARIQEIILLCKLLSLDPYTVCILSARNHIIIRRLLSAAIETRLKHGNNSTNPSYRDIVGTIVDNMAPKIMQPHTIIELEPPSPCERLCFRPLTMTSQHTQQYGSTTHNVSSTGLALHDYLEKTRIRDVNLINYFFRSKVKGCSLDTLKEHCRNPSGSSEQQECRLREQNLDISCFSVYIDVAKYPRCLQNLYFTLKELHEHKNEGSLQRLNETILSCGTEANYIAARRLLERLQEKATIIVKYVLGGEGYKSLTVIEGSAPLSYAYPSAIIPLAEEPGNSSIHVQGAEALPVLLAYEILRDIGHTTPVNVEAAPLLRIGNSPLPVPPLNSYEAYTFLAETLYNGFDKIHEQIHGSLDCLEAEEWITRILLAYLAAVTDTVTLYAGLLDETPSDEYENLVLLEGELGPGRLADLLTELKKELGLSNEECTYSTSLEAKIGALKSLDLREEQARKEALASLDKLLEKLEQGRVIERIKSRIEHLQELARRGGREWRVLSHAEFAAWLHNMRRVILDEELPLPWTTRSLLLYTLASRSYT